MSSPPRLGRRLAELANTTVAPATVSRALGASPKPASAKPAAAPARASSSGEPWHEAWRRPDAAPNRVRMSPAASRVFDVLEPAALGIVATDGPVSVVLHGRHGEPDKRLGHNRGIWPARAIKSSGWRDPSAAWDKSPLIPMALQLSFWAPSVQERDRLAAPVLDMMAARADEHGGLAALEHDFRDMGPELDWRLFEGEIRAIAERVGVRRLWTDDELLAWCERIDGVTREAAGTVALTDRLYETIIARELVR